jgi:hypothetical protein
MVNARIMCLPFDFTIRAQLGTWNCLREILQMLTHTTYSRPIVHDRSLCIFASKQIMSFTRRVLGYTLDTSVGANVFNCPYNVDYIIIFISFLYVIKDGLWRDSWSHEIGTAHRQVTQLLTVGWLCAFCETYLMRSYVFKMYMAPFLSPVRRALWISNKWTVVIYILEYKFCSYIFQCLEVAKYGLIFFHYRNDVTSLIHTTTASSHVPLYSSSIFIILVSDWC